MSSIFTKIINGEIPCYKIYEDEKVFAFLDINPMALGHTLITTKQETNNWLDLSREDYIAVHEVAQKIAKAIADSLVNEKNFERIGQLVDGRLVPHFHLHLVPLFGGKEITHNIDLRLNLTQEQMSEIQSKIIQKLES
jgi:histidine triad (HIT) family protein